MLRHKRYIAAALLISLMASLSSCVMWGDNKDYEKLNRILNEGNEALLAERYDEAISHFDEGLAINPHEPAFLTNKSVAFRERGVDRYNSSLRLSDEKAKTTAIEAAKQDFREAARLSTEAVNLIKSVSLPEVLLGGGTPQSLELGAYATRAEALGLLATYVDKTQSEEAVKAIHEYMEREPDQAKKTEAQLAAGRVLIDIGKGDQAATEYKNVLNTEPTNMEANLGLGLALAQSGDRAKYQEASIYLQRFIDQAPDTHPLKGAAKETLDFTKNQTQ